MKIITITIQCKR